MANIYKRGEIWWGRVKKNGKEFRRSLETRSKSVASERLERWVKGLDAAAWGEKPRLTLHEAADQFIREHGPILKPNTLIRYVQSFEFICTRLGDKFLDEIGPAELRDFVAWRRSAGVKPPTVRRDLAALSSAYGFLIESETLTHNPVSPFIRTQKKRGLKEAPPRSRYLHEHEEAALLDACRPYVREAITFALDTGLRREEQFGLTWDQVDLRRGEITIPSAVAKSKRDRVVVILPRSIELCGHIRRHSRTYVFAHEDGERFGNLKGGLKGAARRGEITDLRWHDLRRTHGCRLLQKWEWTMEMVRDQLGHSTTEQTQKVYAFLEVEDRHRRVRRRTNSGTQSAG